jgi:predicted nucleic acid-binding protein
MEHFLRFMGSVSFQFCRELDKHTAAIYGELRALLTQKYDPERRKKKWLDALEEPTTSQKLGVQENDLWITCQAINLGATLVTTDCKMRRLLEIIPKRYIGDEDAGFTYRIWPTG